MTDQEINEEVQNEEVQNEENGFILNFLCKRSYLLFKIFSFLMLTTFCSIVPLTIINDDTDYKFGLNQLIKYLIISIIQYLMALLVIVKC